jgi:hypothetical protein
MTTALNDRRVSYTAVGGEPSFDFDFPVHNETDIEVIRSRSGAVTTLTYIADYTLPSDFDRNDPSTWTIALVQAGSPHPALAGDRYVLQGSTPVERTADFQARPNANTMADLNREFDHLYFIIQEFVRDDGLAVQFHTTFTGVVGTIPADIAANQMIRRNSANNGWEAFTATLADSVVTANETTEGILETATDAEVQAAAATNKAMVPSNVYWILGQMRGHIAGLMLSNNGSDAANDIDIAPGNAVASDQSELIILPSALTKRLDASWAVGTNQGGLDTGSPSNTTYHVFLIRRPDTGVVDALFSTSASSPTMPSNYTQKRRIGSILRESGAIVAFVQVGEAFTRINEAIDRNSTAAAASALLALSVPAGIVAMPIFRLSCGIGPSTTVSIGLGSAAAGTANVQALILSTGAGDSQDSQDNIAPPIFATNTSRQIYFRQTNTAGTPTASIIATNGWIDRRGRDD